MMSPIRSSYWPLISAIVLSLVAIPATAQTCTDSAVPGTLIGFTPLPGDLTRPNSCNLLPCYKPEKAEGPVVDVDPSCDALSGACPVRARVSLDFPGNSQMPTNTHVRVYWFGQGSSPVDDCLPPPFGSCSPISVCGPLGAEIVVDKGETWIQRGVSCADIASGAYQQQSFSVGAYACQTPSGECTKRLDVSGIELPPPPDLWEILECEPPPPPCEECECSIGGGSSGGGSSGGGSSGGGGSGGGGSAGGGPPAMGAPGSGPGAFLTYKGRGTGHPGYPGAAIWNQTMGRYWSHDYALRIVLDPDDGTDDHVWLLTETAGFHEFEGLAGGVYQTNRPSDERRRLSRTASGWELRELASTIHTFGSDGRWLRTEDTNGNAKVATYAGGRLTSVSLPTGRNETFSYHPDGKLASITEVGVAGAASRTWHYSWSGLDLVRIDRPDGTAWAFRYDDPRLPGFMTRMTLVGTDGSERIESAWEYDFRGNVVHAWRGDASFTGPAAVGKYTFAYDNPYRPTVTAVTDPLAVVTVYEVGRDPGGVKPRIESISGSCGSCGVGPNTRLHYDDPGNPLRATRVIDADGTATLFAYDGNGQMTSRTEVVGTDLERTTTWQYDASFSDQLRALGRTSTTAGGERRSAWVLDGAGRATSRIDTGMEAGNAFELVTGFSYNSAGEVETIDPPGFGQNDMLRYTYDPSRGNLLPATRIDPLVGTTVFGLDPFNRMASTTDPNGLVTETAYDALDRPIRRTLKGAVPADDLTTTTTYTVFGDPHRTTLPEGNVIERGYDSAGRLISVERKPDAATPGERLVFTRNGAGQAVREEHQRWTGSAWVAETFVERVFSSRCQVDRVIHADGNVTELSYDCENRLERMWDANHPSNGQLNPPSRTYAYDDLGRVTTVTEPWGGAGGGSVVFHYGFDVQDHLVRAVDGNGTVTTYEYSDRDLLTREVSEVSGTTTYSYNEHGELVGTTDARGIVSTRQVDALDRTIAADYPGTDLDVDYVWDDPAAAFSRGRLSAIIRGGERIDYAYDRFGRAIRDGALAYAYDDNGNRVGIVYPGGLQAIYSYDFADRPASLTLDDGGGTLLPIVTAAAYRAAGPLARLDLANGLVEQREHDLRYFPSAVTVPGVLDWRYTTDAMGNVTAIDDTETGGQRVFTRQDHQYYLRSAAGPWGQLSWTYDRHGNRLTEVRDGITTNFVYAPNAAGGSSPSLIEIADATSSQRLAYDAAGLLSSISRERDRTRSTYGQDRRLATLRSDGLDTAAVTDFVYDGRNFLARATASPTSASAAWSTRATYSSDGLLHRRSYEQPRLPESPRDTPKVDGEDVVLYFSGRPVAQHSFRREESVAGAVSTSIQLVFLTSDALGTPILATDASGTPLWSGGFEPFGNDYADAGAANIFLRLPGQWQDPTWAEIGTRPGLHYNVHRWYDSSTGRYERPDPIHTLLEGPLNNPGSYLLQQMPYGYAAMRPLVLADPLGLTLEEGLCVLKWSIVGGLLGSIGGAGIGCVAAGGAGTLVAPGVGTVGGCAGGAATGAVVGGLAGLLGGAIAGTLACVECPVEMSKKKGKWTCTSSCHVKNFSGVPGAPAMVTAAGSGPTRGSACQVAISAAQQLSPLGTHTRHCRCPRCWRR